MNLGHSKLSGKGDTILVRAGTCREHVVVNKTGTPLGENNITLKNFIIQKKTLLGFIEEVIMQRSRL